MNLLSIAAAYGVVVAVFQWGWGNELIGLEHTMPINPFAPLMMFAILFGLSMDYEVFLLSRVREEYLATGDSHKSVVGGLSSTARGGAEQHTPVVWGAASPVCSVHRVGPLCR